MLVNEILGDHNVDKQITDNKGDVAYLMADVSDVSPTEIKEIFENLEGLPCKSFPMRLFLCNKLTADSSDHDPNPLLDCVHILGVGWGKCRGLQNLVGV